MANSLLWRGFEMRGSNIWKIMNIQRHLRHSKPKNTKLLNRIQILKIFLSCSKYQIFEYSRDYCNIAVILTRTQNNSLNPNGYPHTISARSSSRYIHHVCHCKSANWTVFVKLHEQLNCIRLFRACNTAEAWTKLHFTVRDETHKEGSKSLCSLQSM